MKIGILGGTFNPVHYGHLILGQQVLEQLKLDKVIYIPCYQPPHKSRKEVIVSRHRLQMLKTAVGGNPFFDVSDIEIKRKGRSYTVDTLIQIKKENPRAQLFFIFGSDLVSELPTWKNLDEIFALARFVLVKRPGFGRRISGKLFLKIKIAQVDISSSLIRELLAKRSSIRYLTPDGVVRYIEKNNLYR